MGGFARERIGEAVQPLCPGCPSVPLCGEQAVRLFSLASWRETGCSAPVHPEGSLYLSLIRPIRETTPARVAGP